MPYYFIFHIFLYVFDLITVKIIKVYAESFNGSSTYLQFIN